MSDEKQEKPIGEFFTTRGFHYRGEVVGESPTHWRILDFKTQCIVELAKASIERVIWQPQASAGPVAGGVG